MASVVDQVSQPVGLPDFLRPLTRGKLYSEGRQDWNGITVELFVAGDDGELVMQCLADQHPVERIVVVRWQGEQMRDRPGIQRQVHDAMGTLRWSMYSPAGAGNESLPI